VDGQSHLGLLHLVHFVEAEDSHHRLLIEEAVHQVCATYKMIGIRVLHSD